MKLSAHLRLRERFSVKKLRRRAIKMEKRRNQQRVSVPLMPGFVRWLLLQGDTPLPSANVRQRMEKRRRARLRKAALADGSRI